MARVVVVGGGFAGLSAAARLAKLRHDVLLLESTAELGGRLRGHAVGTGTWQLSPPTVTLPGVLRDLFRKSGRPMKAVLDLEPVAGRRHVFPDRSVLDLPMGRRSDQHDAVTGLLGSDPWSPWLDRMPEAWDALRRSVLHRVPTGSQDLDRAARRALDVRRPLATRVRRDLKDERLRALVLDPVVLAGHDPRSTPAHVALEHYLERNFGRWRVPGGPAALADALVARLGERRVEVRHGVSGIGVDVSGDRVVGVVTDTGVEPADVVVWCAPTWPTPLPAPRLLPVIPAGRTLVRLGPEAPALPHDVLVHAEPPLHLWSEGDGRWTIAHHNAEDPLVALVRTGIDLRPHVLERHDLRPVDLVRLGHWGWQWVGWRSMFDRPGAGALPPGLHVAGAHAHPGPGLEDIGMATEAIAEHLGAVPR